MYDLDPDEDGAFDVVFMGYVLQMLRDPLRGLDRVRRVCRGHLLLLETLSVPLDRLRAPVARLDARRDGREFFVFNRRGLAKALEVTGWHIEAVSGVIRDHAGPRSALPTSRGARASSMPPASAAAPSPCGPHRFPDSEQVAQSHKLTSRGARRRPGPRPIGLGSTAASCQRRNDRVPEPLQVAQSH